MNDEQGKLLADAFRQSLIAVEQEQKQLEAIKASPGFVALTQQIADLQQKQLEMTQVIPDSTALHEANKIALIDYMRENETLRVYGWVAKVRAKRKVNVRKVLEAMQGDIDNMMLVAKVQIKDLETFATANPEYGKDLRQCIEEDGFTITEILEDIPLP